MPQATRVLSHLTPEKSQGRIKQTVGFINVQKWLIIYNAAVDPRPAREIAKHTGLAESASGGFTTSCPNTTGEVPRLWKGPVKAALPTRHPDDRRPVLIMARDEGRFGRISNAKRAWAPPALWPLAKLFESIFTPSPPSVRPWGG
jgi:hypothetical protein